MKEKKEKKKKSKKINPFLWGFLITVLIIGVLFYNYLCMDVEAQSKMIEELKQSSILELILFFVGFTFGIGFLIWGMRNKIGNKIENKNDWKIKFIGKSIFRFWSTVCVLFAILILFLLGSLHGIYGYESTMAVDLNESLGILGQSLYSSFYEKAESNPIRWFIIFCVIIGGAVALWISDVIDYYKEHLNKKEDEIDIANKVCYNKKLSTEVKEDESEKGE